jgi:hypothetical protein
MNEKRFRGDDLTAKLDPRGGGKIYKKSLEHLKCKEFGCWW